MRGTSDLLRTELGWPASGTEQSAPARLGSLMAPAAGMEAMGFTNGGGYEYGRYSVCTFPGRTECPESM